MMITTASPLELETTSFFDGSIQGFCFDYDGTLTPLVNNPEEAYLTPAGIAFLERVLENSAHKVAIVSGRSVAMLQTFLALFTDKPLLLVGLHGGEWFDCATKQWLKQPDPNWNITIATVEAALRAELVEAIANDWLLFENKGASLAFHYRKTPMTHKSNIKQAFLSVVAPYVSSSEGMALFRVQEGHEVLELLPASFSKGAALEAIARQWFGLFDEESSASSLPSPLPMLFAGDDKTDELGFKAINALGGLSLKVGTIPPEGTVAQKHCPTVEALLSLT
jgi:trehalose 6-phosphate phosphatase